MTPRAKYVMRGGKPVEVDLDYRPRPRVHIISDNHAPFKSHADGKVYDSKSRYRAETKARGYEEVGSERVPGKKPEPESAVPDLLAALSEMG